MTWMSFGARLIKDLIMLALAHCGAATTMHHKSNPIGIRPLMKAWRPPLLHGMVEAAGPVEAPRTYLGLCCCYSRLEAAHGSDKTEASKNLFPTYYALITWYYTVLSAFSDAQIELTPLAENKIPVTTLP